MSLLRNEAKTTLHSYLEHPAKLMQINPIRNLFNDIASRYDLLNHLFSLCLDFLWRTRAVRSVELPPDAVVLDLCAGTADIALALAKAHESCSIYAVDLAENMLEIGNAKIRKRHFEARIQLLHADALALPFSAGKFDAVFLSFGLRNLQNREQGLREIVRVLKGGTSLVILEFSPPPASLFGFIYRLYLGLFIPFAGKVISKSTTAYRYLHTSIAEFFQPAEIEELLEEQGFQLRVTTRLSFGVVCLYVARKAEAEP